MLYLLGITLIGLAGAGFVMRRRRRDTAWYDGLGTNRIFLFGIILKGLAGEGVMMRRRKRKIA